MRVLIDILHPAHVHFFRHFRVEMLRLGHEVVVTSRDKDIALQLLEAYDIPHHVLSRQRTGRLGLATELLARTSRLALIALRFRPDVMIGIMGPSIALAGRLLRTPSIVFYDTETAQKTNTWVYPLASWVVTPDSYAAEVRGRHTTYPAYQELAYLHPDRFTPDPSRLAGFGLKPPYSVVRFTSWQASHDIGESGLTAGQKMRLIDKLTEFGEVAISSEGFLPDELESLRMSGPVTDIHHALAFAQLFIGESGTMSSEAAVLGVPAIFIYRRPLGYLTDLEKRYGLVRRLSPDSLRSIETAANEVIANGPPAGARDQLLADKIDLTGWIVDFVQTVAEEAKRAR